MGELIVAAEGELQRNAKRLDGHDRNRADGGADRDVYKRVLLSVHGGDSVDHDGGVDCDSEAINEEPCSVRFHAQDRMSASRTWLERIGKNLVNALNGFVGGRMEDDHDRPK